MITTKFRGISVLVFCGFCIFLTACSDNKGKDTPSPPKVADQSAVSQPPTPTPASPPSTEPSMQADDGGKCGALLTEKCTVCHSTTRVCEKLGKKSKARWQRTISRMTDRGAKLNVQEAAALLVCLDSGAENLQPTCR